MIKRKIKVGVLRVTWMA